MKAYSEDLRRKIVDAIERGMPKAQAAKTFRVGISTKDILRRARARTKDTLVDVLSEALSAISARDATGYFEHAGYRLQAQLL